MKESNNLDEKQNEDKEEFKVKIFMEENNEKKDQIDGIEDKLNKKNEENKEDIIKNTPNEINPESENLLKPYLIINYIKNDNENESKKEEKTPLTNEIKNDKKEEDNLLINNILIEKEKEKNNLDIVANINEINEEKKSNIKEDTNHININNINNDKNDDLTINKEEEKEELDVNSKEYIKMKSVLINSFILEKKQEIKKDVNNNNNDYLCVEKGEQEFEEMLNNANKKEKCNDIYNYKDVNAKKKIKKFHLFSRDCESLNDRKTAYRLGKILVFTYRKNFPKITNYKTKKTYDGDAWWGCMVRCGQMILARGIYRILKTIGMSTRSAIYFTCSLFNNYPIPPNFLHSYFQGMIKKYKTLTNFDENGENQIKEFFPPFSIRTLCDVGELYERTAGEWFSDVIITGVFNKISNFFELFHHPKLNVQIMTYQSCIDMPDIIKKCFIQKKRDVKNKEEIHLNKKYYYFEKMGIVFINVRLGIDKISKDYFQGIKKLFNIKECIGIIGGKTRLAYYFIGYINDSDTLLYLDPHVSKEAHKKFLFQNILDKHVNKEIHQLKMNKMSTAFTIGFCFRNYKEFLDMYKFWQIAKKEEFPILGMVKNSAIIEKYNDNDEDCTPIYEDKDEDDF